MSTLRTGRGMRNGELETDVEEIHRPLSREPRDPDEGREPVPAWLWVAGVLTLFWGGWYLGRFGGEPGVAVHVAYAGREATAIPSADAGPANDAEGIDLGRQVYVRSCQGCHQADGAGLAGVFPPLTGSEWVTGDAGTVIRILLDGLEGPIEVAGIAYNGSMPAWGDDLSDAEIAAVATYIRQLGANEAGAIGEAAVAELRAESADRHEAWRAETLRAAVVASGGERTTP